MSDLCRGQLEGCGLQSTRVTFRPQGGVDVVESVVKADIGTAGGVCLLAQIAMPCLLFNPAQPVTLELTGGTNAGTASTS